jgi:hypothetical protein
VRKGLRVRKGKLVRRGRKEQPARLVQQGQWDHKVILVRQVRRALLDQLVPRDQPARKGKQALQAQQAQLELPALLGKAITVHSTTPPHRPIRVQTSHVR